MCSGLEFGLGTAGTAGTGAGFWATAGNYAGYAATAYSVASAIGSGSGDIKDMMNPKKVAAKKMAETQAGQDVDLSTVAGRNAASARNMTYLSSLVGTDPAPVGYSNLLG